MIDFSGNRRRLTALGVALALLAAHGSIRIMFNGTYLDEGNFLIRAWLYQTGKVMIYADGDNPLYVPLYFKVLGWLQAVTGPSIYWPRAMSLVFALLGTILAYRLGAKLGSPAGGVLAAFLLAAYPSFMFDFTTAVPLALVSTLWVAVGLLLAPGDYSPSTKALGAAGALLGFSFFTREQTLLIAPGFFAYVTAAYGLRRLAVLGLGSAATSLLVTALYWPGIRKPLGGLVRGGSPNVRVEGAANVFDTTWGNTIWTGVWFFWTHHFFIVLAFGAALVFVGVREFRTGAIRGALRAEGFGGWLRGRDGYIAFLVALFFGYFLAVLWFPRNYCPTCVVPYFNYGAFILMALCGIGVTTMVRGAEHSGRGRVVLLLVLLVVMANFQKNHRYLLDGGSFLASLTGPYRSPVKHIYETADMLKRMTEPTDRIFHLASDLHYSLYMAERVPYRPLINQVWSATRNVKDLEGFKKDGFGWTREMAEEWLASDATVAILQPSMMGWFAQDMPGFVPTLEGILKTQYWMTGRMSAYPSDILIFKRKFPGEIGASPVERRRAAELAVKAHAYEAGIAADLDAVTRGTSITTTTSLGRISVIPCNQDTGALRCSMILMQVIEP
jgi:hypothetical protein